MDCVNEVDRRRRPRVGKCAVALSPVRPSVLGARVVDDLCKVVMNAGSKVAKVCE